MGTQITYSNKPGPVPYRHCVQVCLCKEDLGACLESFPFQTKTLQMDDKGEGGGGGGQTNWGTALIGDLVERNSIKRGTNV